jgi:hypothetical protein
MSLVEVKMPKIIQLLLGGSGAPFALCEDGSIWRADLKMNLNDPELKWIKYKQTSYKHEP